MTTRRRRDLISPLATLAVLLVAFVIVVAAESYGSAAAAVEAEAGRVDQLCEVTEGGASWIVEAVALAAVHLGLPAARAGRLNPRRGAEPVLLSVVSFEVSRCASRCLLALLYARCRQVQ
ncbi:hypothetical protein ACLF6K_07145 [Streptomyces xanthophaeus]|uniref:hypothetical protein n=1 Tax=Streptomyces xanthophaeus TaxID=67385 RepID=UPI00398FC970